MACAEGHHALDRVRTRMGSWLVPADRCVSRCPDPGVTVSGVVVRSLDLSSCRSRHGRQCRPECLREQT